MSIAKEAWPFVLPLLAAAVVVFALGARRSAVGLLVLGLLVALFFRVPRRTFEGPEELLLSAANGTVTSVEEMTAPEIGDGQFVRIATFLSVFNVHVQRSPTAGKVISSRFQEGRKVAAFRDDAAEVNQHHTLVLERANGDRVGVRQIAGLVARRVVCHARAGDQLARGDRFGLIKFGSRVDLYVPHDYEILVSPGDKVKEGLTVVARAS